MNTSSETARPVMVRSRAGHQERIASRELLGGFGRIVIEHAGQEYFLRQTKAGKLILTK